MPVSKKVQLEYKLDPTSKLASFIEWYKARHRTENEETGRKRIGNVRKAILDYLESSIIGVQSKEYDHFVKSIKEFQEDTKLPKELQNMKNYLSDEEFAQYKSLYEKGLKEQEKDNLAA